jgi:HPt (histidine-containing phosphotransfer) domain-containing protein
MSNNDTPLDISTLVELRTMLEEGLDELLVEYLVDTRLQLTKLHTAVASGDNAAIVSISHTLKGSSGNLGVSNVYHLCQALEREAHSGSVLDAQASLHAIEAAFERAQQELAAFQAN